MLIIRRAKTKNIAGDSMLKGRDKKEMQMLSMTKMILTC